MAKEIADTFNKGIVIQAYEAQRNVLIWQYVADESEFLSVQSKDVKLLYHYLQQSAQTNFILSLGKLFDKPSNKYPTRCILSFLKELESLSFDVPKITEVPAIYNLLSKFNCPNYLKELVANNDSSIFLKHFAKYYLEKYSTKRVQDDIESLKLMRDKVVAHNEEIDTLYFDLKIAERLLDFATEIISIFGMAYSSTIWVADRFSFIKANAERNALFVKVSIYDLKGNINNA